MMMPPAVFKVESLLMEIYSSVGGSDLLYALAGRATTLGMDQVRVGQGSTGRAGQYG